MVNDLRFLSPSQGAKSLQLHDHLAETEEISSITDWQHCILIVNRNINLPCKWNIPLAQLKLKSRLIHRLKKTMP